MTTEKFYYYLFRFIWIIFFAFFLYFLNNFYTKGYRLREKLKYQNLEKTLNMSKKEIKQEKEFFFNDQEMEDKLKDFFAI